MDAPESSGLPEWIRWALGVIMGAFLAAVSAVSSWVGMRRDLTDVKDRTDRHSTALGTQGDRVSRLELFERSTVEKLDNVCERLDDHREEFRTFTAEVRAFMARAAHGGGGGGGRHG